MDTYADYNDLEHAAMAACRIAVLDTELVKTVCSATCLERASPRSTVVVEIGFFAIFLPCCVVS